MTKTPNPQGTTITMYDPATLSPCKSYTPACQHLRTRPKMVEVLFSVILLASIASCSNESPEIDPSRFMRDGFVTAKGEAAPPANLDHDGQEEILAKTGAKAVAQRNLLEQVNGVLVGRRIFEGGRWKDCRGQIDHSS